MREGIDAESERGFILRVFDVITVSDANPRLSCRFKRTFPSEASPRVGLNVSREL